LVDTLVGGKELSSVQLAIAKRYDIAYWDGKLGTCVHKATVSYTNRVLYEVEQLAQTAAQPEVVDAVVTVASSS